MAEVKKNTRVMGLKDIYIAEVTVNNATTYTTGKPIKLGRALSAKVTDSFNVEKLYSDDSVEGLAEQYSGTTIEIGVNTLTNSDFANLYNVLYDNGFLAKSAEDTAKEIALGYRAKRMDGTYDFVWHYAGKFTDRPEQSYETQGEKISTQTATLKGEFYSREKVDTIGGKSKHLYELKVNESELLETHTEAKEAIADWFSEVQEYKAHA